MAQINWGEDIQNFFNNDLAKMVTNLFKFPTNCLAKINEVCKVKSIVLPLMTLVVSYIVSTLMFLIMGADFGGAAQLALLPVFFVAFICILTFGVMAAKGKSDINLALNHTTVHSLIFTIFIIAIALFVLISGDGLKAFFALASSDFWGILMVLAITYGLSLGISSMRQLLKDNLPGNDSFAWWISPCIVVVSLFLAFFIAGKMM